MLTLWISEVSTSKHSDVKGKEIASVLSRGFSGVNDRKRGKKNAWPRNSCLCKNAIVFVLINAMS